MNDPRVLIDAANLHSGGGLQVAASFVDELALLSRGPSTVSRYPWLAHLEVEASSEVVDNIAPTSAGALHLRVRDRRPSDRDVNAWTAKPAYDVCFSVFGPVYGRPQGKRCIVGFADGTSIYDVPEIKHTRSRTQQVVSAVRRNVSRALFSRADRIVVEAPHVRSQLQRAWGIDPSRVDVVPNCLNAVFTASVPPTDAVERSGWVYVTRSHPHKNIRLLGAIGDELHRRGVTDVTFTLTLTDAEWEALDDATRAHSRNVGAQLVEQLPALYGRSEGSVFPSLLESFSAAPLEAVASDLPLVASDRSFVHDVVGDAALYADPNDAAAWAEAIISTRQDPAVVERLASERRLVRAAQETARERALSYLAIIDDEVRTLCQSE